MHVAHDLAFLVHLRRAGLAADAVALHLRVLAAALRHHAFEQFAHGRGGLRGNRRGNDVRLRALHDVSVLVQHFLDDIRTHQPSSVDHRAGRGDHLKRCHRHALAKADAREIHVLDVRRADQNAASFARQVDAGGCSQPERAQVAIQPVRTQPQRQFHEHRITGILDGLLHRLRPVGIAPAADGVAVHLDASRAVKGIVRVGHTAVQRGGCGQHLERRSRFVYVADRADAHQALQRLGVVSRRIVRVVIRLHRHGQHLAGVHVHHDCLHPDRLVHLDALPKRLFNKALNFLIDRQPKRVPGDRRDVLLFAVRQRPRLGVHFGNNLAGLTGQIVLIVLLQARLAYAVHVGNAQRLRKVRSHRIPSFRILVKG